LFSEKYFGKKLKDLNKKENHKIDCFGLYGCIDWLEDNGHLPTLKTHPVLDAMGECEDQRSLCKVCLEEEQINKYVSFFGKHGFNALFTEDVCSKCLGQSGAKEVLYVPLAEFLIRQNIKNTAQWAKEYPLTKKGINGFFTKLYEEYKRDNGI